MFEESCVISFSTAVKLKAEPGAEARGHTKKKSFSGMNTNLIKDFAFNILQCGKHPELWWLSLYWWGLTHPQP